MKILVTGGAGFIGSNFLHYYAKKHDDYEIVCLDDLTYAGNFNNIIDLVKDKKIRFVKGNIVDRKFVFDLFKKEHFDLVINFAAESHVTNSIDYPDVFFMTNVIGTQVLLDASRKYKVARFHHSADALTARTAQLPKINFEVPPHVIGTNTIDCLKSGILYSNASALDGIIDRMEEELGEKCTVVATGGLSELVVPLCRKKIILDSNLLIKGLAIIYKKNKK